MIDAFVATWDPLGVNVVAILWGAIGGWSGGVASSADSETSNASTMPARVPK